MAVLSQDFGGLKLSGCDANTFVAQVKSAQRSGSAVRTLARGRQLLHEMSKSGKVKVASVKGRAK